MRMRAVVALIAAGLLLSGCSGSTPSGSTARAGPTSSASGPASPGRSATPAQGKGVAPQPRVGDCYRTTKAEFRQQRGGSRPVRCSRRHTAETFAVFPSSAYPKRSEIDQVWRVCQARFAVYVGNTTTVSTLGLTLMLPDRAQIAHGQKWIRCDAIQTPYYNATVGVARTGSLRHVLRGHVPKAFRGCAAHWPKSGQRVRFTTCAHKHQAELIPVARNLGGPNAPYPGTDKARKDSKAFCARTFQHYVPQTRHYYFYYPTRASWRSGSHDTTCWAVSPGGPHLPPL